jgi:hypothetical protein
MKRGCFSFGSMDTNQIFFGQVNAAKLDHLLLSTELH